MNELPLFPATGVGSLPYSDPRAAVRLVLDHFLDVPYWPQLPRRTFLENMYTQFAAGLPGAEIQDEKLVVEDSETQPEAVEAFYERFITEDLAPFALPAGRAAALPELLSAATGPYPAVKGQVTGPVSFGLMITNRAKKPLFYNPIGRDILVKHLLRVAQWQVAQLKQLASTVILVLDEPYLASVGSAILSLSPTEVVGCLDEIFAGLPDALPGIHCCANTDWGLVLSSQVRYLSFDAYGYADALLLYPEPVRAFLDRDGRLAFGIVPTAAEDLARETAESLAARMEGIFDQFERRGIPRAQVVRAAFLTPACGLGTLSEAEATRAIRLTNELAGLLRCRYEK